jgi:hypothetical protein
VVTVAAAVDTAAAAVVVVINSVDQSSFGQEIY